MAVAALLTSPPWDRELIVSGLYRYAPYIEKDLELEPALKAGTLVYDRDGAAATVSVRRLTGALSLAIDGKVDASNAGDMLTQKALAHVPLLLHPNPHEVCVIGLGSGVTLGSALVHPITHADVVEISPEVVEASRLFSVDNHNALDDPRTRLILGDGRSHLLLSSRKYDVIISEPSNPWMAGVAALFTREFFTAARHRLAPGGVMCQWAHTYDISDCDLRSIVATFGSVFPEGTIWMIGESDILLVSSTEPLDARIANIDRTWRRPGVAADLSKASVSGPFAIWSLFAGGPEALKRYGAGAPIQRDDRMALEFSGPRSVLSESGTDNAARLRQVLDVGSAPPAIRHALTTARAAEWRDRGNMLAGAHEYAAAYESFTRAVGLDATDRSALEGLVRTSAATHHEAAALELLNSGLKTHPTSPPVLIAKSKLLASEGSEDQAVAAAVDATRAQPVDPSAFEQLASVFADLGDAARLQPVVDELQRIAPGRATTWYYAAAVRFLGGQLPAAIDLARQAVQIDPTYAQAQNLMGAIQASLGHRDEARGAFEASLRLNPNESETYTNLGLLELSSGNRTAAAGYFEEALSLEPKSTTARQGLAQAR
jgi:spermidine synthase